MSIGRLHRNHNSMHCRAFSPYNFEAFCGAKLSLVFFFSSRRRHTRLVSDWSSDVCSSDLKLGIGNPHPKRRNWTAEEDQLMGRMSDFEVARRTGRSYEGVQARRRELGLPYEIGRASCRERV